MGKKKFIDKKKSATFQLLSHDSSDPYCADTPGSDRVFVRIDNNPYFVDTFDKSIDNLSGGENPCSIFSDSPDDDGRRAFGTFQPSRGSTAVAATSKAGPLPEHLRREILELGFPDDGYNYLIHLREIKNTGGGSLFCCNCKAKLNQLPQDVKAFDASRVQICEAKGDSVEELFYNVATKTVGVKVKKAVDPDVAVSLEESDLSRFGSDVENLEEDFVVRANLPEEGHGVINDNNLESVGKTKMDEELISESTTSGYQENHCFGEDEVRNHVEETGHECVDAESRVCRLLDEQFDLLECQEYRSDGEDDDGYGDYLVEDESLAEKFKHVLTSHEMDDFQLDGEYEAPADVLRCNERSISKRLLDSAVDVVRHCVEYTEKYENVDEDELAVISRESSDELEQWDCETIVSTDSNLDNRPGKIDALEVVRKKKFETMSGALSASNNVMISLQGKEKLPVDFVPQTSKSGIEKVKGVGSLKAGVHRSQQRQESKLEKKELKAAVKHSCEERNEGAVPQRAQRVAAISGPSSIHLM